MSNSAVRWPALLGPWLHALTPLHSPRWLLYTEVMRRSAPKNDSKSPTPTEVAWVKVQSNPTGTS
jgi:hypothetical protein